MLRGLSLRVRAGESVAIVGSSGSGKSTVIALLTALYRPSGGAIFFDGHALPTLDVRWLRTHTEPHA